jgi:Ca2+/Na+ antiporter
MNLALYQWSLRNEGSVFYGGSGAMTESSIVCQAESLIGSCALVALILVGLGTLIGLVKPSDTAKHCGVIVGVTILLVLLVSVFVGLWATMTLWQRFVLAAMVFAAWRMQRQRHAPRRKRDED